MKFLSQLITVGSGSVGGLTASHNRGGNYFRARVIPVNPQTGLQSAVRDALTLCVNTWINVLGGPARNNWNNYASNVPVTDSLGQSIFLSGQQHFIRSNVPRVQALGTGAAAIVNNPPFIFDTGEVDPTAIIAVTAPSVSSLIFDVTLDWVDEDDSLMMTYYGRPQNATINFYKGPYRFAGLITGNSITPPTSPDAQTVPFAGSAGQRIFAYSRISRADGRLSAKFMQTFDIIA